MTTKGFLIRPDIGGFAGLYFKKSVLKVATTGFTPANSNLRNKSDQFAQHITDNDTGNERYGQTAIG